MRARTFILVLAAVALLAFPAVAAEEEAAVDKYVELLRKDIQADKVLILTEALDLPDQEAQKFWPVYRKYEAEVSGNKAKIDWDLLWNRFKEPLGQDEEGLSTKDCEIYGVLRAEWRFLDESYEKLPSKFDSVHGFDSVFKKGSKRVICESKFVKPEKYEKYCKSSPVSPLPQLGWMKDPNAAVASIGPGGENLVRFANLIADLGRGIGRTGVGAVVGSKKLKWLQFIVRQPREHGLRPCKTAGTYLLTSETRVQPMFRS